MTWASSPWRHPALLGEDGPVVVRRGTQAEIRAGLRALLNARERTACVSTGLPQVRQGATENTNHHSTAGGRQATVAPHIQTEGAR